jgi:ribosomal-protein-alanine N-acetyltransferase
MITAPQELRTARLLLRSFDDEDVPALVRLAGAREVAATTLQIPHPYTELDARNFLAQAADDHAAGGAVIFAISILSSGELCGAIGLHLARAHGRAELGYWMGVPFWGKGYATEAASAAVAFGFDTLRLHRIFAHHFTGNIASQRVLEKIGMRHEGRFPQHIQKWDQFIDVENYGLLAEEYRRSRARGSSEPARRGE